MKALIKNPILPGFNPDPSIIRVGEDYYVATSTFEWFPGVQIYRSKDLASWELIARPLCRTNQLDLLGVPDSCGIWAPCLSYDDGVFYLAYTIVRTLKGIWRDMRNYIVTSETIDGEWSDPAYLNGTGQDPSLFHDDDGRKWFLNAQWEYIQGKNVFSGIVLQEYSTAKNKLIGPITNIFTGTKYGYTEGPHLYKKDGYYYLMTAEGGTWYDHCVTIARSRNVQGPYELHPQNPILTSKGNNGLELQKAGHGDFIETDDGWYIVHLCGRPFKPNNRCTLGRETAIQKISWGEDGWPYLQNGSKYPENTLDGLDINSVTENRGVGRDDFDGESLDINYQGLRVPMYEKYYDLSARKGYLRIIGRESLSSVHFQSLIARRLQSFRYSVQTALEFDPQSSRDIAGLVIYYNTENYIYLCMSQNKTAARCLRIITCHKNVTEEPTGYGVPIKNNAVRVYMRMVSSGATAQFSYSYDEAEWHNVGEPVEIDKLSDEYIAGKVFTGTFAGICCQAMSGDQIYADFDYFEYLEH